MRILIADDHPLVRRGMRSVLLGRPDIEVCGEAANGHDAVAQCRQLRPDIVLMDINMPQLNGLEAIREVRREVPEAGVVVVTQHDSAEMARQAMNAGAKGYVLKSSISESLMAAIDAVGAGKTFFENGFGAHEDSNATEEEILRRAEAFERALRESEERFRLTFEQAAVGMAHVAADGSWLRVNQKLCDILGYPQEELSRLRFQDVTYPGDVETDLDHLRRMRGGEINQYTIDKRYVRKDGSIVWANLTVGVVRRENGAVKYFISVIQDISGRKQMEEQLRERDRQLRGLIDGLPAAIYTTDENGFLTHYNRAAVEFAGRVPKLGVDRWCMTWKLFEADGTFLPHEQCPMAVALKEGRDIDGGEVIAERPDGTRRWFTPYPRVFRDAHGKITGGLNMLVDITARKEAEEPRALLAAIVDSSDEAIVSKDLNGVITSWNKGAERVFGYTAEETIGKSIRLIIPRDRQFEEDDILARLRRGESIDHFETVRVRKDGSPLDVSLTISPIRDSAGRIVGASKVARDISERKRAEERLRALKNTLEEQVRARTAELEVRNAEVTSQSEELRELSARLMQVQDDERRRIARELHDSAGQILTGLGLNLATVAKYAPEDAPTVSGAIEHSQELVAELTEEIRTMSYLLHPPLLEETGLADAILWYVQGLKERSALAVEVEIAADLPRLSPAAELVIFRIVQESLTNIHRHSGSRTARIRIALENASVVVEIQDEGHGIPAARLADIQTRGSGVGIRGMRERVRQLKGEMTIQSGPGGTTVRVSFQAHEVVRPQKRSASPEPARLRIEREISGAMRALVVDDSALVRRAVCNLISEQEHWEVCGEAASGAETLARARELQPDLVLLDINLPDMSGIEVVRQIRSEMANGAILVMSHHDPSLFLAGVLEAGADGCLDKGNIGSELSQNLNRLEEKRHLAASAAAPTKA